MFEVSIFKNTITLKSSNGNFVGFLDNKTNIIGANNQRKEIFEFIEK
jgi:hypothetical protein